MPKRRCVVPFEMELEISLCVWQVQHGVMEMYIFLIWKLEGWGTSESIKCLSFQLNQTQRETLPQKILLPVWSRTESLITHLSAVAESCREFIKQFQIIHTCAVWRNLKRITSTFLARSFGAVRHDYQGKWQWSNQFTNYHLLLISTPSCNQLDIFSLGYKSKYLKGFNGQSQVILYSFAMLLIKEP